MNYLLEYLPENYLQRIADYFAELRPPFPAPAVTDVSHAVIARGEQLVKQGDYPGISRRAQAVTGRRSPGWSLAFLDYSVFELATSALNSVLGATGRELRPRRIACKLSPVT